MLCADVDLSLALKAARGRRGQSIRSAAKELGVSHAAVARWEDGRATPAAPQWPALAAYLGISAAELVALVEGRADRLPADPGVAHVDRLEAQVAQLTDAVTTLQAELAALQRAVIELVGRRTR